MTWISQAGHAACILTIGTLIVPIGLTGEIAFAADDRFIEPIREESPELQNLDTRVSRTYEQLRAHLWREGLTLEEKYETETSDVFGFPDVSQPQISHMSETCGPETCEHQIRAFQQRHHLEIAQRKWQQNVLNTCTTSTCLTDVLERRLWSLDQFYWQLGSFTLAGYPRSRVTLVSIGDPEHSPWEDLAIHERHLMARTEKLLYCDATVEIAIHARQGNRSYGGICYIRGPESTERRMICADRMLGRFAQRNESEQSTLLSLAEFVYANCYGG